ncbi:MAG: cytochrome P450, partial [Pseudomonadota bacterium]
GPHKSGDNFNVDPPLHSRRRGLVDQAFGGNAVAEMEPHICGIVSELVDEFIDAGEVDLVSQYAIPIAIYVISDLLNVPRARRDDVKRWSDAAVAPFGQGLTKDQAVAYARDMMEMHRFIDEQIKDRRDNPGDDIISKLVHARIDDPENPTLSHAELLSCSVALLAAGNETTRNGIGWGLSILASDPALFERLQASLEGDGKLLNRFVEETLRIEPPVPQLPRVAIEDCEIGGVSIPKGSLIFLCWASGNRDTDRFETPDVFDVERKNVGQHMTFGHGVHRCVGAMLARMEMKCAFREVLTRMSSVRLADPDAEPDIWGTFVFRGLRSLPVRFEKKNP